MVQGIARKADIPHDGREAVPERILELREKLKDKGYIDAAIERIALVVSRCLTSEGEEKILL